MKSYNRQITRDIYREHKLRMPSPYVFTQWFTFGSNGSNVTVDNLAAVDNMFTPARTIARKQSTLTKRQE